MAEPASTAFFTGLALESVSSFMSGMTSSMNADADMHAMRYNAQQERYAATQAYQEGSLNKSMTALAGRQNIASGAAAMSAAGNIGTSAQSAIRQGAFNLDKDLAAMDYRYANEAIQHRNLARNYDYSASVMKGNRNQAFISSFLSPAITMFGGATRAYEKGYKLW